MQRVDALDGYFQAQIQNRSILRMHMFDLKGGYSACLYMTLIRARQSTKELLDLLSTCIMKLRFNEYILKRIKQKH